MLAALEIGPRIRRWLIGLIAVAVALDFAKDVHRRMSFGGDFDVSREFGRRFLHGEYLYTHGLNFPYPPVAAMYFSPLAMLPSPVAYFVRFAVALLCLWLTLRMWHRMLSPQSEAVARCGFLIGLVTVFLASHFIVRDLDDGGPHLILLAIITAGVYAAFTGRKGLAAGWLGLAIAVKITPGLFVPFLFWKREWRLGIYTAFATLLWMVSPALRMGPVSWYQHTHDWVVAAGGYAIGENAATAFRGHKRYNNQALHAACLTILRKSSLSPRTANDIGILVVVGVMVLFCWRTRRRYPTLADPGWPLECGALLVLVLLLSPITWEQHLVLMIPALYLITAREIATSGLGRAIWSLMILFALLSLVLTRDLVGKQNYAILLSYDIQTVCMLIVFGIILVLHSGSSMTASNYLDEAVPVRRH